MRLILVNIYPMGTMARYLLSSYVLKAYLVRYFDGDGNLSADVVNFSSRAEVPRICEKILAESPDCIGYSCYIWNIEKVLKIISTLRKKSNAIHILGGPEISLSWVSSLSDPSLADYYVIGEGERKLVQLLHYMEAKSQGTNAELPNGVAHWGENALKYSEDTCSIVELDEIPSIYLNGAIEERLYARQQAFLETQRGCRYRCKYCVYRKFLSSIHYYSQPRVFDELDYLIVKKQVTALRIFDAIFTSDLNRAKEIVRHLLKIKNKGVHLPWIFWEFTYNSVDEEFIKLTASLKYRDRILNTSALSPLDRPQLYSDMLQDYTVINSVGIESFDRQVLKAVGRPGINIEKFGAFMDMAKEYNIVLKADLILGLPGETFDSYFEGIEAFLPYCRDTDHILNIHRLQILPGSELESLCGMYRIKYSKEAPHVVFSTQSFPEEDLNYAAKLTAVLFRVINSPLRRHFFAAKESMGVSFYKLAENILDGITTSEALRNTRLVQNDYVDDDYWNDGIFREIPSQWLTDFLKNRVTA